MARRSKSKRHAPLPAATLRWVYFFRGLKRRVESRNTTEHQVFLVLLAGRYHARWIRKNGEEQVEAGPGQVVYLPRGVHILNWNDPDPPLQLIRIDCDWPEPSFAHPRLIADRHGLLARLAQALLWVRGEGRPEHLRFGPAYLQAFLSECTRLTCHSAGNLADELTRLIDERERVSLEKLARHFGMERHTLARHYRKQTGHSPMQDARRMRLETAETMIRSEVIPFKQIAVLTGFYDSAHFCRLIKKRYGATPGTIRRRAQEAE